MIIEFVINNKEWIFASLGVIFSYFTGRKIARNQETSGELQNLKAIREVEKQLFDDINKNIDMYKALLDEKDKYIKEQTATVEEQKEIVEEQKIYIKEQRRLVASLKRRIKNLEAQIKTLKDEK